MKTPRISRGRLPHRIALRESTQRREQPQRPLLPASSRGDARSRHAPCACDHHVALGDHAPYMCACAGAARRRRRLLLQAALATNRTPANSTRDRQAKPSSAGSNRALDPSASTTSPAQRHNDAAPLPSSRPLSAFPTTLTANFAFLCAPLSAPHVLLMVLLPSSFSRGQAPAGVCPRPRRPAGSGMWRMCIAYVRGRLTRRCPTGQQIAALRPVSAARGALLEGWVKAPIGPRRA